MSILSNNKPVAHLGRTSHDLSSTHAFSMRPAVLRPVVYQDCVPDSAFRINVADLVRTSSLQTAAFLRGKHELDFFFVPYSMLYSGFEKLVLERGDMPSPALSDFDTDEVPSVPLPHLYYCASLPYVFERFMYYCYSFSRYSDKYRDSYGSFLFGDIFSAFFQGWMSSPFSGSYYSVAARSVFYEVVDINAVSDIRQLSFIGHDVLSMLDTAGYGNFSPVIVSLLDTAFDRWTKTYSNASSVPDPSALALRLRDFMIDLFEKLFGAKFDPADFGTNFPRVNPLRLFAYQKVFFDRYRDSMFDEDPLYSYSFSMDWEFSGAVFDPFVTLPLMVDNPHENPLLTFLRPRTRMIKKDIVSGLFPSAQFGSQVPVTNDKELEQLNVPTAGNGQIGAANIRFALAAQKYRETLLRAGSRSKDVLKAIFGVESQYINDTYVRYLGSFSGQLDLNKVSATADSGTYSVGDLAGNIFSSLSGQTIEFTCNDFGCIVGVMSFFPEVLHNNFGLSPHVLKSKTLDYFKPAFEDLGLQPVSTSIISAFLPNGDIPVFKERTLGFSARYNEYKANLDFSHDQFGTAPMALVVSDTNSQGGTDSMLVIPKDGFNSNYVVTRPYEEDITESSTRNYLLPNCMDSLFTSVDTGDITNYHFDIILDCQINAILPMSNLGLPY